MICELWFLIVQKIAEVHGAPLPKKMLSLGESGRGWFVKLNNTGGAVGPIEQATVCIEWNDWPAGIIDHSGGIIGAGEAANEAVFRRWLAAIEVPHA